ncbi:SDR family oxidoreductase [Erythrobacter insulae]|uniref:SDR family oxidoreductase n=1 Tax=Erythrobacter insulae TaxID=2584124 RepID=A0A547PA24_9SPHN|nr:SDR family oxidoreductase [Erythrobacter insulae]TRD10985.1 SDR family oxidoreductase [Erythrobacter insulae]
MKEGAITTASKSASYPDLEGKRVIVSGGASGIGAGIVQGFVKQGCAVGFVDLSEDAGNSLCRSLDYAAHQPVFETCDVTDIPAYTATLEDMAAKLGGCDVLINNAGNDHRHTIESVTESSWDDSIAVNLKHQFFAAQSLVKTMRQNGGGSIINLGSISWHLGIPDLVVYQTAKAAIEGLTRSLARELGRDNIRVNAILPGNVETPRQKQWYSPEGEAEIVAAQCLNGRIQPSDIAAMALFLASQEARFCTGHNYWVDAGWR